MKITDLEIAHKKIEKKESIWVKDIHLFGRKLSDKDKAGFYQQLLTLIESGIDISTTLGHIVTQNKKKYISEVAKAITNSLIGGASLSEAFNSTRDFTQYEVISIRIGEETGALEEVLSNLNQFYEEKIQQKREIISALSYPVLIITAAIGAVFFMIFFIIPVFEDVFSRFGGELPYLTRKVIDISSSLRSNSWIIPVAILFIFGIRYMEKRVENLKFQIEAIIINIPLVGELYLQALLAKFCNSMGLLIDANISLLRALELNELMYQNLHLVGTIKKIKLQIIKGTSFSDAVNDNQIFDLQFRILIKVGEESSKLGYFFRKLATDYRTSIKHKTTLLNTILEPVLIILLGLVVGTILISMYLPMFDLSSQMSISD